VDLALPNLHPALVHFPLALVPLALLFEVGALFRDTGLRRLAAGIWALAAVSTTTVFFAGRRAADGLIDVPAQVQPRIGEHSDWATATLALLVGVAILRGLAEVRPQAAWGRVVHIAGALLGSVAGAVLFITADKGGALVYRHAVAVTVPECPASEATLPAAGASQVPHRRPLLREQDGVYAWSPTEGDLRELRAQRWPERGIALAVSGSEEVIFEGAFGDVQVNAWLDLSAFDGHAELVHHQSGGQEGAFVFTTSGEASLVDRSPGRSELDVAEFPFTGRHAFAISAAGFHLKGLVDGQTVVHGHAPAHEEGTVALRFEGIGIVGIERAEVVPLGEP